MVEVYQAGVWGLLRTLLVIFIVYYLIKYVFKFLKPFLWKKIVSELHKRAGTQPKNSYEDSDIKEGETVIDKKPKSIEKESENVGEYIDFDEVD